MWFDKQQTPQPKGGRGGVQPQSRTAGLGHENRPTCTEKEGVPKKTHRIRNMKGREAASGEARKND